MSEILKTVPHQKEYNWAKIELWKEALKKTIEEVKSLDAKQTMDRLWKYKTTKPGLDSKDNTFEMMALYQRAIQLLWDGITPAINARFGTDLYKSLMKAQKDILKFTWKDGKIADGLPGPTTTTALIKALGELQATKPTEVITEEKETPTDRAKSYLTVTEKYKNNLDWTFTNPTWDVVITIQGDDATMERGIVRKYTKFGATKEDNIILWRVKVLLKWGTIN
jgi:hypothetical protein